MQLDAHLHLVKVQQIEQLQMGVVCNDAELS
jgi:hypothetical protein